MKFPRVPETEEKDSARAGEAAAEMMMISVGNLPAEVKDRTAGRYSKLFHRGCLFTDRGSPFFIASVSEIVLN